MELRNYKSYIIATQKIGNNKDGHNIYTINIFQKNNYMHCNLIISNTQGIKLDKHYNIKIVTHDKIILGEKICNIIDKMGG